MTEYRYLFTIMNTNHLISCGLLSLALLTLNASCKKEDENENALPKKELTLVAQSEKQWTGITVSSAGRMYVNYPNWSAQHSISVADITDTSKAEPYPDAAWNTWSTGMNPAEHFICVQSVYIDENNVLWVLDAANPQREGNYLGVVDGGAKLVKIDLNTHAVTKTIVFTKPVLEDNSYLNDIRIDEGRQIGYITDSNEGALIVVDLAAGTARRVLAKQPVTKSENAIIHPEGKGEWRNPQGKLPTVHADGIALSKDESALYWRALTGHKLYRLSTDLLRDASISDSSLNAATEVVGSFLPADGILYGKDGKVYMTSMNENGVRVVEGSGSRLIVADERLKWPDALYEAQDGYIYVSASQLHLVKPPQPYKIFKFKP